jgi:hypothetical protein
LCHTPRVHSVDSGRNKARFRGLFIDPVKYSK